MTVSKPYTFIPGTDIIADEVNANFDELFDALNNDYVDAAGTLPFQNIPSGPASDPTTDNQFTRKKYVDDLVPRSKASQVTGANGNITSTANFTALPVNLQVSSFTKRTAGSRLHVAISTGVYNNNGLGTFIVGVRIGSTDYPIVGGIGSSMASGDIEISGLAAGTYTIQARARVGNGVGTAVQLLVPMTLRVAEVN